MKLCGKFRQIALCFLSKPLMAVSAVFCVFYMLSVALPAFSLAFAALFACVAYHVKERFGLAKTVAAVMALSALCYALYAAYDALLPVAAAFLKERYFLFGGITDFDRLLFGGRLTALMLHTDYSGAVLMPNGIVSGVSDIYAVHPSAPSPSVSRWLSGAYFSSLFLPTGQTAALWKSADKWGRALLVAGVITGILTGDTRVFLLSAFLVHPLSAVAFAVVTAIGYWCSAMLDFRLGYMTAPSLAELLRNSRPLLLFLLSGVTLAILLCYACRYLIARQSAVGDEESPSNER